MPEVAFIGAGSMGRPMVERLLAAGVPIRSYARRADVREELGARGAMVTGTVAEAVKGADLCILCLFSGGQVEDVALGEQGVVANLAEGGLLLVHSTVSPATLALLSAAAAERGVRLVDAPISGTAEMIRAGKLTVLIGAEREAVAECEPVIGAYAGTILHVGGVGAATRLKLVNNLIFAAHAQVAESAVRLGKEMGIEGADLVSALAACSGDSYVFAAMRAAGTGALARSVRYLRKDVAVVAEAAKSSGIGLGLLHEIVERGPLPLTDEGAR